MPKLARVHYIAADTGSRRRPQGPPRGEGERRSTPRVPAADLPPFSAHLVDGPDVEVVNVSKTGILTRSHARLMPGAMIGLRVLTADDTFVLFGRVVRSSLLSVDGSQPVYESALALARDFPLLATSGTAAAAAAEPTRPAADGRPDGPYPLEIGRLTGAPIVLTVTAFANEPRENVMKAFDVNES
jgi:hypothetical protein